MYVTVISSTAMMSQRRAVTRILKYSSVTSVTAILLLFNLNFNTCIGFSLTDQAPSNYWGNSIPDPRFARSTDDLLCLGSRDDGMMPVDDFRDQSGRVDKPFRGTGGPGKPKEGTIGCCPNTIDGRPYGPGKNCCFGSIYVDDGERFCCDNLGIVMNANDWNRQECERAGQSYCQVPDVPSPMLHECTQGFEQGSNCTFYCPDGMRVREPDDPTYYCDDYGEWVGISPECCLTDGCPTDLKVDFYFIIDSSSSIGETNFQYIREYIIQLVSALPIGQDAVRVGLVTYNTKSIERFAFNTYDDKDTLIEAVLAIPYNGRGTYTNRAIEWATTKGMIREKGDRPDVPNFIIVLTDGKAKDDVSKGSPALQAKGMVIAIGVGRRINKRELTTIAGAPENVYLVSDFRSLRNGNSPTGRLGSNSLCPTRCVYGDDDYSHDYE